MRLAYSFVVLLGGFLMGSGCSHLEEQPSSERASATRASDAAVLQAPMTRASWLEALRAAHGRADGAHSASERETALAELGRIFREPSPLAPAASVPVLQDVAQRAARLSLDLGRAAESKGWSQRGLALGDGLPVFRANLLVGLADAERALGETDAAREHLVQALGINQDLLDQELETP